MSSVNKFPTMLYDQPEEYHFSHDSVFLARSVYEKIVELELPYQKILDLCAGCGIIGFDLAWHLLANRKNEPMIIEFLEIQQIYHGCFLNNLKRFNEFHVNSISNRFLQLNYDELSTKNEYSEKYNLIISNPPYFRKGMGILSDSDFKNRCRFFLDSDFKNLIVAINFALAKGGSAFVLLKSLKQHGISIEDEFRNIESNLKLKKIESIRGTDLYHFEKS
jgi:tRNA1Val (adenine37-N6)-methyltransferase